MQAKALDLKSVEDVVGALQHAKEQEFTFSLVRTCLKECMWILQQRSRILAVHACSRLHISIVKELARKIFFRAVQCCCALF